MEWSDSFADNYDSIYFYEDANQLGMLVFCVMRVSQLHCKFRLYIIKVAFS